MITAEKVYKEILEMPVAEREKLFAVIARKGFEKEFYTLTRCSVISGNHLSLLKRQQNTLKWQK